MKRLAVIFQILLVLTSPVWSGADDSGEVRILSDSLKMMDQTGVIQFEGSVRIQLKEATLTCDRLTVRTDESDPSRVVSGVAAGNVLMVRGEERVEAGEARFDLVKGTVDLTGSPSLLKGRTTIQAERIIYSLEQGTAEFLGPVRAVFLAEGE